MLGNVGSFTVLYVVLSAVIGYGISIATTDLAVLFAFIFLAVIVYLLYLKVNLKICEPNEILIFSGRTRKTPEGEVIGYRIIKGGRALKIPIVEVVNRLPLSVITIDVKMEGALSAGMIPINIDATAHVKIASTPGKGLENAVERLLGKPHHELERVAKTVVEGVIRGVIAKRYPEEINEKRLEVEEEIFSVASKELQKLGFTLDSIKIEEIVDSHGYLDAIGRKKNAVVKRDARITELEAEAETLITEATSKERAEKARYEALKKISEHESSYRDYAAALNEKTYRNEVRAEFARKEEELERSKKIEELKIEVNTKKYNAEVVIPAEAERKKLELIALGKAAELKEEGFAMAEAVKKMAEEWDKGNTKELFMLHILPGIVERVSKTIADNLKIERMIVLGDGIPKHVGNVAGSVVSFIEQIKNLTGLDITKILEKELKPPLKKEME